MRSAWVMLRIDDTSTEPHRKEPVDEESKFGWFGVPAETLRSRVLPSREVSEIARVYSESGGSRFGSYQETSKRWRTAVSVMKRPHVYVVYWQLGARGTCAMVRPTLRRPRKSEIV